MRAAQFLIIGQGISGTLLSWYLKKSGHSFIVADNYNKQSSSRVAAGLINPVTGRRIVQTWMIDTFLPFAINCYEAIGADLDMTVIERKKLIDFFPSPQMVNAFNSRVSEKSEYLSLPENANAYREIFNYDFGFGQIDPCYIVDVSRVLERWRNRLKQDNELLEEEIRFEDIRINEHDIRVNDVTADRIIFCDGVYSENNPWFKNLPFAFNKGEALILKAEGIPDDCVYKKTFSLVPLRNDLYWAGSSYEWNFADANPSELFRQKTENVLKQWIKKDFKVIDHVAALRPATVERRPFAGTHPHQHRVGILNGMGTKGCSLAPYFASQLADHLTKNTPILAEANVNRFSRLLSHK